MRGGAELGAVGMHDGVHEHVGEWLELAWLEALHEPEVEERDPTAGVEEVVAGMGIAVERLQTPEAAEHEAVDRLGGEVAFGLAPLPQGVEADTVGQLRREDPFAA